MKEADFTYKDLTDSDPYFYHYRVKILQASKLLLSEEDYQNVELYTTGYFLDIVYSCNRGFAKLVEIAEPIPAMAIVRMQLENLATLYAEALHPNKVLKKIYGNGRRLDQLKFNQKYLATANLLAELGLADQWEDYSKFVHPDKKQTTVHITGECPDLTIESKQIKDKTDIEKLSSDMVAINQKLDSIYSGIVDSLEEQLKLAGKWEAYSKLKTAKVKRVWIKNGKIVKEDNY